MPKTWEELRAYRKAYYEKNKDQILKKVRTYRKKNIVAIRERDKKRYRVLLKRAEVWGVSVSKGGVKTRRALSKLRKASREEARLAKEATYPTYTDYDRVQQRSDHGKWKTYQQGAKQQKRLWELTRQEFFSLIRAPCYYHGGPEESRGVDRIDSAQGYTSSNVVPCCSVCNRMKNAFPREVFFDRCRKIAERFPSVTSSIQVVRPCE
jgi:hypothetical protein